MRPISLCLVTMGKKGLEMVKAYPEVLPPEMLLEIPIKSMPLGAKEGDFISTTLSSNSALSGYVFKIPRKSERDNIASLVAVFDQTDYNASIVRKVFTATIEELKKNNSISVETIEKILPYLYSGIDKGHIKIKISSVVTIEMNIAEEKEEDSKKKAAKSLADEMWK